MQKNVKTYVNFKYVCNVTSREVCYRVECVVGWGQLGGGPRHEGAGLPVVRSHAGAGGLCGDRRRGIAFVGVDVQRDCGQLEPHAELWEPRARPEFWWRAAATSPDSR